MQNEELLEISSSQSQRQSRQGFLRKRFALFSLLGFVFFLGAVCTVCFVGHANQDETIIDSSLITRSANKNEMQQYSRVLTVEITPNSVKLPENAKLHKKVQTENMIVNFYPIQKKPQQIIALQIIDQQESSVKGNADISKIAHEHFPHEVHSPQKELYFLVLDKRGQFSTLLADQQVSEKQLEKVKHIVQQYTPELDSQLYETPKQYTRATKLGQAKVQHEKVYEDADKVVVKHAFNGNDIEKASSFQKLDSSNYDFSQTHHFSKATNKLEHSDLHEKYHFESDEGDMFTLGLDIQTHQKLQLLKTKQFSEKKQRELLAKYYAMKDTARAVFTLTPNELRHTSDLDFAQSVKDQLFPSSVSCPVKERTLQQANDDITMLTNKTFTVYNHPQQSFLGFTFKIIDEITIYLDKTNKTMIFDNSLVLEIQRDSCFKQFTLIEFTVPMTTNFTYDFQYIEAAADAWLENLEDFFKSIYNKFQDFLKKIKADGIHSNSSWTGIDKKSSSNRDLSLKSDLDQMKADLSKWNEDIIDTLSHTSKQYHYSKPISYEYNLDFYGITLQFSFGFTFALDGSYEDNLLDLYTYNKQVLINYIDILVQDYQTDMEYAQKIWKNLSILLQDCTLPPYESREAQIFKQWQCVPDPTELDYSCYNSLNEQKIHITKAYYDYMEIKKQGTVNGNCLTEEIKSLEQDLENQLKQFYDLRETKFLNLINLTYIPQFKGDVYIKGYVKVTLVPWLNDLAMSISLSGDLLNAVADVNIYLNVKPFFTNLISLIENDISSEQYLQDVESAVAFDFNIDVQVVNITLTWTADTAVVDFVLDVAEVMKSMWGQHTLRSLEPTSNTDLSVFSDIFSDAASKFESGLEKVIADIYCEFFTSASGIAEAFTPETVPLYQFLWANAGCNLPKDTLENFSTSDIQCTYSTAFQVIQLWDPSKYK